jgi:hypothetical protein
MAFELINALIPSDDEDLHFSIAVGTSEYAVGYLVKERLPFRLTLQLNFEYIFGI